MHAARIAAIALVASRGAPAAGSAGVDRETVEGVVARVGNEGPCAADRDRCSRQHVAFGGALVSTQPAWIERLVLRGRTSRGSSVPSSGIAIIRGAGGGLRGLRGAIEVRPGSTVRYRGALLVPQPGR
jgi:hypothetical protein